MFARFLAAIPSNLPGLLLALGVALLALGVNAALGAPVMLAALFCGVGLHVIGARERFAPGVKFASTSLLRLGIVLLAFRLSLSDIVALGWKPSLGVVVLMAFTMALGLIMARLAKRPWTFGVLTAGAVAICGASAALALAAVLPRHERSERETLLTIVGITALSTLSFLAYPPLLGLLGTDPTATGFILGATIHDVAQVVGAGYSVSPQVGDTAVLVKLQRVALLPVMLLILALAMQARQAGGTQDAPPARFAMPWFVTGFAVLALVNSTGLVPPLVETSMVEVSRFLLIMAIGALGLNTTLSAFGELRSAHALFLIVPSLALFGAATLYAWLVL